jgi:Predicted UDP-glucose 6-dehydrogenase
VRVWSLVVVFPGIGVERFVVVLGLIFKSNIDDMRDALALDIVFAL